MSNHPPCAAAIPDAERILCRWLCRCFAGSLHMIVVMLCCLPFAGAGQTSIHVGFSRAILKDVNENDAMAAVKAWSRMISRECGRPSDPYVKIFKKVEDIAAALTDKTVDCVSITPKEYVGIRRQLAADTIIVGATSGSITESYVLLVHRDSGIAQLSDLRGHTIQILTSIRGSLGPIWIETLLAKEAPGSATDFFAQVIPATNTGKTVLPVFFRQVDICMVTRSGFATMIELNPQIGRDLKVMATSPPVVPMFFCFRADYDAQVKNRIMDEVSHWHLNPAGRQTLMLFQLDRLEEKPITCLDGTLELLATHRRFHHQTQQ